MSLTELNEAEQISATNLAAAFFDNLGHPGFLVASLEAIRREKNSTLAAYICYDPKNTQVCFEVASQSPISIEAESLASSGQISVLPGIHSPAAPPFEHIETRLEADSHETQFIASPKGKLGIDNWTHSGLRDKNGFVHRLVIGRSDIPFQESECRVIHHAFPRFLKANKYNTLIIERRLQIEEDLPLSKREKEIAALIAEGKSNPEIGQILSISSRTVEKHCSNIFAKMGFENRNVAIRYLYDFKTTFSQP